MIKCKKLPRESVITNFWKYDTTNFSQYIFEVGWNIGMTECLDSCAQESLSSECFNSRYFHSNKTVQITWSYFEMDICKI